MRVHIIQNGEVSNTIAIESLELAQQLFPDSICIEATEGGTGWVYQNGVLSAPEPLPVPVPQSVTMRQARLALHAAGLLAGVDAAIASLSEPAKTAAAIEWEYAAVVERNAGLVPAMAAALGMSEADIDDLFITAATL